MCASAVFSISTVSSIRGGVTRRLYSRRGLILLIHSSAGLRSRLSRRAIISRGTTRVRPRDPFISASLMRWPSSGDGGSSERESPAVITRCDASRIKRKRGRDEGTREWKYKKAPLVHTATRRDRAVKKFFPGAFSTILRDGLAVG